MNFRKPFLVLVFFGGFGLFGADVRSEIIIQDGVLNATSESAWFSHDFMSGEVTIRYADGSVVAFSLSGRDLNPLSMLKEPIWVQLYSLPGDLDEQHLMGVCSQQAQALQDAINFVQSACSGDGSGSATCNAAMAAYDMAASDYGVCLAREHALK